MDVDLALLLSQAAHSLTTELTAELAALGITPRAHCVLSKARAGDLTQNRLAELCNLDKTTMVVTMDELERAGLAARRPSTADRRARIISVTDAGARVVAQADEIVARIQGDVLDALPARERTSFVNGLARLAAGRLSTPVACERAPRRPRSSVR
ncbi:MAG: MarR family winged helix-turn-helix transcriptional regulator [Acidimicrobiales bacterium]